ncbi:MAG: hypothetical protein JSS20_17415 [Proteobacteria bacterium]|nr:hypothetical protein [Pseudomonadota bacterium]
MVPDSYTRRARIYPALLASLPGLALAAVMVSWKDLGISHAVATVAAGFLLYAFGDLTRRLGKRNEDAIYREIGGKPSTAMLRHSDTTFDEATKSAWLKFLASKIGGTPPTDEEEKADPAAADTYYDRCGNWLRENTRDHKKFYLVFDENVAYGFRRNLYGLKWLGLALNALVVLICAIWIWNRWPVGYDDGVASRLIYVVSIALAHALFFIFAVTKEGVIEAARQYGRQLLLACETLATGAPLKKAAAAPKQKRSKKSG